MKFLIKYENYFKIKQNIILNLPTRIEITRKNTFRVYNFIFENLL